MTDQFRRNFLKAAVSLPLASTLAKAEGSASEVHKKKFSGKTFVITGGTSGIGKGTLDYFVERGAYVYFCGRRKQLGETIAKAHQSKGNNCEFIQCDVRSQEQVKKFAKQISEKGKLDYLFLNAGVAPAPAPLHETSEKSFLEVIETHLLGNFYLCKEFIPAMMHQKQGVIIFNTSFGARRAISGEATYAASKLALNSFVQHIAIDYRKNNIRAYGIEPLGIRSEMLERRAKFLNFPIEKMGNPYTKKLGEPIEIAKLVEFLISDESHFLNGTCLDLSDGGSNGLRL